MPTKEPPPLVPCEWDPNLQIQGGLPESSVKPRTPRSQLSRWAGGALMCHLISKSPLVRLPAAAPLPGAALPQDSSTLRSTVQGGLGILGECWRRGKKSNDPGTLHSNLQPRNTTFSRAPTAQETGGEHGGLPCPCGRFL